MTSLETGTNHPLSPLDALAQIEQETQTALDPLAMVDHSAPTSTQTDAIIAATAIGVSVALDPLSAVGSSITLSAPAIVKQAKNLKKNILEKLKFLVHYVAVSSVVFAILLVSTNWSAYYTIAMNTINPGALKASGLEMTESLSKSKITVFASGDGESANTNTKKEQAQDIKKQLEADNVIIQEDPFSMKHLLPSEPNIKVGFEITPYENRLIIPKIGKNIPLVDIMPSANFDFDHMENIFMQELEKGVVRYPGSALPGEQGNSFIFGHSSNYPWMKGNYNDIFALLDDLEYGDEIIVYYNQKKFVYVIREKKVVTPGDVKALNRDPNAHELSLMTCWPVGTTLKRMLVFAELQK